MVFFSSERKTDDDASTTNVAENVIDEVESAEGGSDGVSSEGEKTPVPERVQVNFVTNFFLFSRLTVSF